MAALDNTLLHSPPPASAVARVSTETVERAVNALLKWRNAKSTSQKPQLLEQEDFVQLILTLKKIPPKSRTNAFRVPLPHPLHSEPEEFCLIIDDRSKSSLTSDSAKKKIKSENIPISKVIKLSKLKSDYRPFEAKRKLCDSYDVFFADKRVIPLLPKLLGKNFFLKKKIPVPVDLTHKNWKEQIERACSSAMVYLRTGTCSVVKVAKASMESGEIVENVVGTIDGILKLVPKKWEAVRSLHLKFSESLALPIYQAMPDMKFKIEGSKKLDKGVGEESKSDDEKLGEKKSGLLSKKKKKGRIHEVKYMDGDVATHGDKFDSDEFDDDKNEEEEDRESEKRVLDDVRKKRKKRTQISDEGIKGENNEDRKLDKKRKGSKKKVMIHKVGDMDGEMGAHDDELETETGVNDDDVGKKREKGDMMSGQKRSKKSVAEAEKRKKSGAKDFKDKSEAGKLEVGASKVKDRKSKKN